VAYLRNGIGSKLGLGSYIDDESTMLLMTKGFRERKVVDFMAAHCSLDEES
jgi:hypothetical protein